MTSRALHYFRTQLYVQLPAVEQQVDYWRNQGCRVTVERSAESVAWLTIDDGGAE